MKKRISKTVGKPSFAANERRIKSRAPEDQSDLLACYSVAPPAPPSKLLLNGDIARRRALPSATVWDTLLPGFGLRQRTRGGHSWIVKFRERGRQRLITLGRTAELAAEDARTQARGILERAALDGLPVRQRRREVPLFRTYAAEFWRDYAHHWKPSTEVSNARLLRRELLPVFGSLTLDAITRADVLRWRDGMVERGGAFNRTLPVLAVMMIYAEQLGYRRRGSNPCKGIPRYKRKLPERYLSAAEYRRLGRTLSEHEAEDPTTVAVVRLLIYTGARKGEIETLRWEHVEPDRLLLADSKTGPKTVWLNAPARAVLESWCAHRERIGFVFPGRTCGGWHKVDNAWRDIRRHAALPDLRLHDLRHSFASVAIADGISLTLIGRLLGHALPETTARYAHLADELVADAADRVCGGLAAALGVSA
jgi:integrase